MVLESAVNSDLEPELRSYCDEVRNINHAAEELVRNLSEAELLWKPGPGRWSIAQCLDHLVSAGRTELPSIRRAITEGRSRKLFGHGPYHYRSLTLGSVLIKVMSAGARLKFKAPKPYLPSDSKTPADVIRDFFLVQQELSDYIRQANGLHLVRTKVPVLDFKYIRLTLGQEFKLIVAHEQRHILQAQRIKHRLPHITVP